MPAVVVVAAVLLLSSRRWVGTAGARLFLVVTMAGFVALVQFPYATPTYFCYVAPMTILAVLAIVSGQPAAARRLHVTVAAFFLAFAIVFVNRSYGWNLGVAFLPYEPVATLGMPRGGLRVPDDDQRTYDELVRVLNSHAAGGAIFAGPDCPEVYFLSGFPNPTRTTFEFLSEGPHDEQWMTDLLERGRIRAVVVNTAPLFSPVLAPEVLRLLEQRFPMSQQIGRFVVRFADVTPGPCGGAPTGSGGGLWVSLTM
jgi:hypothetical protein